MSQDFDIYDPPYEQENSPVVVEVGQTRNSNSVLQWLLALGIGGALCYLLTRKPDSGGHGDPLVTLPHIGQQAMWYGGTSGCGTIIGEVEFTTTDSSIPTNFLSHMNTVYVILDPLTNIAYWFDENLNAYSVVTKGENGIKRNVVTGFYQYGSNEWKELIIKLTGANVASNLGNPPDLIPLSLLSLNKDNFSVDNTLEFGENENDYYMVSGKRIFKDYFPIPLYDSVSGHVDWVVGTRTITWYKIKENTFLGNLSGAVSKFGYVKYEIPYVGTFTCARKGTRAQVKRNSSLYHTNRSLQACNNVCERWAKDNTGFVLSKHHAKRASRQWSSIFGPSEPLHNLRINMQPYVSDPIDMDLLKVSIIMPTRMTNSVFDGVDVRALLELLKVAPNACYWFQPQDANRANAWLKYMYEHTSKAFKYNEQVLDIGFEWVGLHGQSSIKLSPTVPLGARTAVTDFFHRKGLSVIISSSDDSVR